MDLYGSFEGPLLYALIVKESNQNIGYVQMVPLEEEGNWEIVKCIWKA